MGERSNRRPIRYEKDQSFRHGRTTQRLLSHRRHRDRDAVGMGNSGNKLDVSTISSEEKATVTDTCKPSVKKLLEEEMLETKWQRKR